MKNYYSKSKFVMFCACHKRLWLEKYKEEYKEEVLNEERLVNGNLVGDLAMSLFGDYYLAETKDNDLKQQAFNTLEAIKRGEKVICEAAFILDNHYCAVDILVREDDSFSVYEVKSTTGIKPSYYYDLAYQYYVLSNLGYDIKTLNLVHIDSSYVLDGELDINKYFKINDLTDEIKEKYKEVCELIEESDRILNDINEPKSIMSRECNAYNGCPFLNYCKKVNNIPLKNSVYDLYSNRNKVKQVNSNILSFEDLLKNKVKLSEIQARQIDFALNNRDIYVDKVKIKEFLDTFKFPLYFFDFETFQDVIPSFKGTKPYQQIPFQYSLHILNSDRSILHKEFLGDGINNPIYDIVDSMINDLGDKGSIVAYNDAFEKGRIKELSQIVVEHKEKLETFIDRFVDLADVFQKGYCYNKEMGGSFSIKSVLPALFPNDPSLNYKNLEDVHKGDEASATYLALKDMDEEEYKNKRNSLLKYCELDTYAMVRIYQKLLELIK